MFSKCIISSAATASLPFVGFLRIWTQDLSFAFPIMVTMCALRQCFGWQMWVRWLKSEEAEELLSHPNGKISWLKDTKCFPLVFSLWIKIYKMVLKRKIIVLPTHNDIVLPTQPQFHSCQWEHSHALPIQRPWSSWAQGGWSKQRALGLWSWMEAKSYCTAIPEPQNQTRLRSPRGSRLPRKLSLSQAWWQYKEL